MVRLANSGGDGCKHYNTSDENPPHVCAGMDLLCRKHLVGRMRGDETTVAVWGSARLRRAPFGVSPNGKETRSAPARRRARQPRRSRSPPTISVPFLSLMPYRVFYRAVWTAMVKKPDEDGISLANRAISSHHFRNNRTVIACAMDLPGGSCISISSFHWSPPEATRRIIFSM